MWRHLSTLSFTVGIFLLTATETPCADNNWISILNADNEKSWEKVSYKIPSISEIKDGMLILSAGHPFTGRNWTQPFPQLNYEIRFEGMRTAGNDFFASLTFPVADSHCTLITGGWGGDIVGLSSIDGWDASENETRTYFNFENDQWYSFHLAVRADQIQVRINDKPLIKALISGRAIGLRPGDTEKSRPLGFATYNTTGVIRKVEYRLLNR